MTRPQSEAQYLASFPAAPISGFTRRGVLKGGLAAGALAALSACGGSDKATPADVDNASGEVTFGNNQADAVPLKAITDVKDAFEKANDKLKIKFNTVAHTTFQDNINNYLQGSPDDAFGWFAGYRAAFFAEKNLVGDISDVYSGIQGLPEGLKASCSTPDGKAILVPATYYPWVVLYKKSVFEKGGYEIPKSLDELKTLAAKMKKDGLIPFAMADKDGWEAMGMFDILSMRVNGYDHHMNLMRGKEDWTSEKVVKIFDTWKGLLEFQQPDSLGRSWQEAAQALQKGQAGMYYLGTFAAQQFAKGAEQDDLGFFNFPEVDSAIGADAIEAPTDGYMMSKRPKNEAGAKKWLGYLGGAEAQNILVQADPSVVATNSGADTAKYTSLQNQMLELLKQAKHVSLFLDRDSRPDFASTVMGPAIQNFLKNPNDIAGMLKNVQAQKTSIFGS